MRREYQGDEQVKELICIAILGVLTFLATAGVFYLALTIGG